MQEDKSSLNDPKLSDRPLRANLVQEYRWPVQAPAGFGLAIQKKSSSVAGPFSFSNGVIIPR
jgi:hypothetical protein